MSTNIDDLTLGQLKEIAALTGGGVTQQSGEYRAVNKGRYIVIGNRGNIVVGDLTIIGNMGHMKKASVIRRWGTTKGLGQLAMSGATGDTVLDGCGEFEFDISTTCGMIKVQSDL